METIQNENIELQMKSVFNLQNIQECLQLKIHLMNWDIKSKNEYERNEIDIQRIQCEMSIAKIKKVLGEKNKELQDSMQIYAFALKNE
jgi:hypothetical protein